MAATSAQAYSNVHLEPIETTLMLLAAADRQIDGRGDLTNVLRLAHTISIRGLRMEELKIAPLRMPWTEPLPNGHLRGATAPLEAITIALSLFESGQADALLLSGADFLRSGYTAEERKGMMQVFAGGQSHLVGYERVTETFIKRVGISRDQFLELAEQLFENYLRTYRAEHPDFAGPERRWFGHINSYFRGVDCANPYIDFSGAMILLTERAADLCGIDEADRIRVLACELRNSGFDTLEDAPLVAGYAHLTAAFESACQNAGIDFATRYLSGDALLEVYSCYPVVPLAFLHHTGLVRTMSGISAFLHEFELTVTGGLNLARAPWNNTTLNSIVAISDTLRRSHAKPLAGIHSNASLGYQQGFLILGKV